MRAKGYFTCLLCCVAIAAIFIVVDAANQRKSQTPRHSPLISRSAPTSVESANVAALAPRRSAGAVSLPFAFEPNVAQADPSVQYIGRGTNMTVLLRADGIEIAGAARSKREAAILKLQFTNRVYLAGGATSWDFPWQFNLQPFTGDADAFVAELDPTSAGSASLIVSTPLGGTAAPGAKATAVANGIAVDSAQNIYVAGATTAADFPTAAAFGTGVRLTCASCQQTPSLPDAFLVEIAPSAGATPSVSFSVGKLNLGTQPVGSPTPPNHRAASLRHRFLRGSSRAYHANSRGRHSGCISSRLSRVHRVHRLGGLDLHGSRDRDHLYGAADVSERHGQRSRTDSSQRHHNRRKQCCISETERANAQ